MDKNKELFLVLSELFNNLDFSLDQDWVTAQQRLIWRQTCLFSFFFPKDFVTPTDKAAVFEAVV